MVSGFDLKQLEMWCAHGEEVKMDNWAMEMLKTGLSQLLLPP